MKKNWKILFEKHENILFVNSCHQYPCGYQTGKICIEKSEEMNALYITPYGSIRQSVQVMLISHRQHYGDLLTGSPETFKDSEYPETFIAWNPQDFRVAKNFKGLKPLIRASESLRLQKEISMVSTQYRDWSNARYWEYFPNSKRLAPLY